MGNVRFGFLKAILGVTLLLSSTSAFALVNTQGKNSCGSLFQSYDNTSVARALVSKPKLAEHSKLKIANWNLLDFKINIDALERGVLPYSRTEVAEGHHLSSKTIEELNAYKKILEHLDADIYIFQEAIGGSLKYFAEHYLKGEYQVVLESSKKDTELQIAFLVRKSLDVQVEVQSYEHLKWQNTMVNPPQQMQVFHKDLPALYLRQNDGKQIKPSDDPNLIIFGTHFKSMRDSHGDPNSTIQRTMQMQTAARVIHSVNQRYRYNVPIMLTGDFNAHLKNAPEVEPLKFFLKDTLVVAGKNQSLEATYTHEYHRRRGDVIKSRLDGQLVNEALRLKLLESYVEHFNFNKSDHSPVVSYYDMTR